MADKKEMAADLLSWIKEHADSRVTIEEDQNDERIEMHLKSDFADGYVTVHFLDFTVVEYRVTTAEEESAFYLHFELQDLDHAEQLYTEMQQCILAASGNEEKHILLCCSCGLTTSFFAMKLNEAAKSLDLKMDFEAVSYEKLYESSRTKDMILLAPQIGFQKKNAEKILTDKIILEIPVAIFSGYKVFDLIELVKDTLAEKDQKAEKKGNTAVSDLYACSGSLLIVSVVNMAGRNQIAYRVYDSGKMTAGTQIVKNTYQFSDILDVIRLVTDMTPEIETVCLVTPGSVYEHKLTYESANIFELDAEKIVQDTTGRKLFLFNETDMIALGYAEIEKIEKDLAFYFVPTGSYCGSIGMVINGALAGGTRHMGGSQLDALSSITTFPRNPYVLAMTPEGNLELAARYITGIVSYTGIEHIAFYSSMIPDAEMLVNKTAEFISERYLPEIIKADSIREYLYAGALKMMNRD